MALGTHQVAVQRSRHAVLHLHNDGAHAVWLGEKFKADSKQYQPNVIAAQCM